MAYAHEKVNIYVATEASYGAGASHTAADILFAKTDIKETKHFVDVTGLAKKRFKVDRLTKAKSEVEVTIADFDFPFSGTAGMSSVNALLKAFFGNMTAYADIGAADASNSTQSLVVVNSGGAITAGKLIAVGDGTNFEIRLVTGGDDTNGWSVNRDFTITVGGNEVYLVNQNFFDDTDTNISLAIRREIGSEEYSLVTGMVTTEFKISLDQAATAKANFAAKAKDLSFGNSFTPLGYSLGQEYVVGLSGATSVGSYDMTVTKIDFDFKNGMDLVTDTLHNSTPTKIKVNAIKELTGSLSAYSDNIYSVRELARGGTTASIFSVVDLQPHAIAVYIPKAVIEPFAVPSGDVGEIVFSLNFTALYDYTNGLFPVFGYI